MKRFLYWLWRVIPLSKRMRAPILWLGNRKFVIGISALILNDRGEVLLFKHTYRNDFPWSFPGGYLKKHEDPDEAMKREIYEESGFEINILQVLEVARSHEMARFEVLYQAELVGESDFVPSIEVKAARFFSSDELPELLPEHEAIIEKYLKKGE
jgi:ADP-ribose pyrophosphatase YjhB (NUDIX family)